jgi:hypothetical protein
MGSRELHSEMTEDRVIDSSWLNTTRSQAIVWAENLMMILSKQGNEPTKSELLVECGDCRGGVVGVLVLQIGKLTTRGSSSKELIVVDPTINNRNIVVLQRIGILASIPITLITLFLRCFSVVNTHLDNHHL